MFDTFCSADGKVEVQTKVGPNLMYRYAEGERVHGDFPPDVIIAGLEGFIVIREGVVLSVTEEFPENAPKGLPCITKWGGPFDPKTESLDEHNPIAAALKTLREA